MSNFKWLGLLFMSGWLLAATDDAAYAKLHEIENRLQSIKQRLSNLSELRDEGDDAELRYFDAYGLCQGRLTVQSGTAIPTTDQTGKTTLYFTPYQGNLVGLYSGTVWNVHSFSEISLALGTLTSGANYDVFLYNNSGTLTLELSSAWSTDTSRANALTTQSGVYVKSGALTRRYLGTIRTTSTTTTEDSNLNRFVWNQCNPVPRKSLISVGTATHTYSTSTWRGWNNSASDMRSFFIIGMADVFIEARVVGSIYDGGTASLGVGVDSASTNSARYNGHGGASQCFNGEYPVYSGYPSIGYHYLQVLEIGSGANSGDYNVLGRTKAAHGRNYGIMALIRG